MHFIRMKRAALGVLVVAAGCGGTDKTTSPAPIGTSISLEAPSSIAVGGTLPVIAGVIPTGAVSWSSGSAGIAMVSSTGDVTGIAPGNVTIRATSGQASAAVSVTIFDGSFIDLIVAPKHVCARDNSRALYCWGNNASGMLGPIATPEQCIYDRGECSTTPVPSIASIAFTQVAAGMKNSCGREVAGDVYCWGGNAGQVLSSSAERCGDGELCARTPLKLQTATSFAWIGVGSSHFCGLTTAGNAYCWGNNDFGQLGAPTSEMCGTASCSRVPIAVSGGLTFHSMSVGEYHTCGLTALGRAYCWGWNFSGQLGSGKTGPYLGGEPAPVPVATNVVFATIRPSLNHTCALTIVGEAYCWGYNSTGQLGNQTTSDARVPQAVTGGLAFDSITTGLEHTCAITHAGVAYCWGHNLNQGSNVLGGQLGDGTFETRLSPTLVARGLRFVQIGAGRAFTCGRSDGGTVYCWGSNAHGQIGAGDKRKLAFTTPTGVGGIR